MNISNHRLFRMNLNDLKLIGFILFFLTIATFSLQAKSVDPNLSNSEQILNNEQEFKLFFEITSDFIASWKVMEVRDHVVLEVITTSDFMLAHELTTALRKFVNEPILVKHGYDNGAIAYKILIGRFSNVDEAEKYHNLLR